MNVDAPELKLLEKISEDCESGFVEIEGESFYRVADSNEMAPFLMNVVSGSNHWMFIASNGALTAGRRNADNALFPYCTQDKLFELAHTVGSVSAFWVEVAGGGQPVLWEPFAGEGKRSGTSRNLYKNTDGSRVIFEEVNRELGLRFRYAWSTSEAFGFARRAELENIGGLPVGVRLLDGIQNLVPYGLDQAFVSQFSNLSDAYKKNELIEEAGLGVYYLSSIPTDRAEPSEGLKATVAWSLGLEERRVLVSSRQLAAFRRGEAVTMESETRGLRCSYLVESNLVLGPGAKREWWIVADINQDAAEIEGLRLRLEGSEDLEAALKDDIALNEASLRRKIGASDGFQLTAQPLRDARHRSNTLFNIMRGGIFDEGYDLSLADFRSYLKSWNTAVLERYATELDSMGERVGRDALVAWAKKKGDLSLMRLANEYLPLSFSRRHGDPSRPWNKFSIETQDEEGKPVLAYQGNWRDIFQNWEPLAYSYPGFLTGMISRFLNSSTADGYNPYRVTRDGFDWEILDPEEPWSNIGYWGDHQVIYLLKLLEALKKHNPQALGELLEKDAFVYAHVPYRIRGFAEIWENPRETVDYDDEAATAIGNRSRMLGADGKLLLNGSGETIAANLWEKLLAPLLAKMSNFVLEGGIWMNTQRPEWNDANNALVGYGVSVVTLCYVNRYLAFLKDLLPEGGEGFVAMDLKMAELLESQLSVFERNESKLDGRIDGAERFVMLKDLGEGGERFRCSVYGDGFGEEKKNISFAILRSYLEKALLFVGHSIDSNQREDGMYHSYNLLSPSGASQVEIERLSEMLEGQVAVLSSNRLSSDAVLELLESLRHSRLYRADVDSYLLYPDRDLPSFLDKNKVDAKRVEASPLLVRMVEKGDGRILSKDVSGTYRFRGDLRNSGSLAPVLKELMQDYPELLDEGAAEEVLRLFEDTFNHRSFTGRSGTFFAYEGLGSVYWHMVSKLALAIQENCLKAVGTEKFAPLADRYFETLKGLGFDKTPQEYGAFPIDAYSHTPLHAGAQQPGMTGQVKEDILSRWGELGVRADGGRLHFDPKLLKSEAFLQKADTFEYWSLDGEKQTLGLEKGRLAFTYCQTPVIYRLGGERGVALRMGDGREVKRAELELTREDSAAIFNRDGSIERIEVTVEL